MINEQNTMVFIVADYQQDKGSVGRSIVLGSCISMAVV